MITSIRYAYFSLRQTPEEWQLDVGSAQGAREGEDVVEQGRERGREGVGT